MHIYFDLSSFIHYHVLNTYGSPVALSQKQNDVESPCYSKCGTDQNMDISRELIRNAESYHIRHNESAFLHLTIFPGDLGTLGWLTT